MLLANSFTGDHNKVEITTRNVPYDSRIIWFKVYRLVLLHLLGIIGLVILCTHASGKIAWFTLLCILWTGLGVTAGAHRLWSHRAYKATVSYRIFLMLAQTACVQNDIYVWVRDHRVHHRYAETDADPHNIKRGFLFAHCGWLCTKKHPDVTTKGSTIDCSDILKDPVCAFQRRYYGLLVLIWGLLIPTAIPVYFWNEAWISSFFVCICRITSVLNGTWLVNSWAHLYGTQPYDNKIHATETLLVSSIAVGEGFHNYHHVFPYDYRASELGWHFNFTTLFIDTAAQFGFVYDRREAPKRIISRKKLETLSSQMKEYSNDQEIDETAYSADY